MSKSSCGAMASKCRRMDRSVRKKTQPILRSSSISSRATCRTSCVNNTQTVLKSPWRTSEARITCHLPLPSTSRSQARAKPWVQLLNRQAVSSTRQLLAASPSSTKASQRLRSNSGSIMVRGQPSMLTTRTQWLICTLISPLWHLLKVAISSLQVSLQSP